MTASWRIDIVSLLRRWAILGLLTAILPPLLCVSAQARPRDEAMAGAYHCAAIADSRQWLDCYYGAAQPVRGALGMKPAPATQTGLVSAPRSGAPAPAGDIGVRDAVMSAAAGCATLAEERQWLDCYYAAAQPMRATLHLTPAPQVAQMPRPAGNAVARPMASPGPADDAPVLSRMTAYSFDKHGFFAVTLSNGQVWRQVDGDTTFAHWKKPAANYLVRITPGFLNSHNFQVKGSPGLYKVLRVS